MCVIFQEFYDDQNLVDSMKKIVFLMRGGYIKRDSELAFTLRQLFGGDLSVVEPKFRRDIDYCNYSKRRSENLDPHAYAAEVLRGEFASLRMKESLGGSTFSDCKITLFRSKG